MCYMLSVCACACVLLLMQKKGSGRAHSFPLFLRFAFLPSPVLFLLRSYSRIHSNSTTKHINKKQNAFTLSVLQMYISVSVTLFWTQHPHITSILPPHPSTMIQRGLHLCQILLAEDPEPITVAPSDLAVLTLNQYVDDLVGRKLVAGWWCNSSAAADGSKRHMWDFHALWGYWQWKD